jgi:hypothetical protein
MSPTPPTVPSSATAPSPTPTPIPAAPSTPARSTQPDSINICKITDGNEAFNLNISSAAAHNFTECGIPPVLYNDTIDDPFTLHGMDQRCLTGNSDATQEQAVIGVHGEAYSHEV